MAFNAAENTSREGVCQLFSPRFGGKVSVSANGAIYTFAATRHLILAQGDSPGFVAMRRPRALKERLNNDDAPLQGAGSRRRLFPRVSPWANMRRRVAANTSDFLGQKHITKFCAGIGRYVRRQPF